MTVLVVACLLQVWIIGPFLWMTQEIRKEIPGGLKW